VSRRERITKELLSLDLSWPVSGQARVANAEARRTLAEPDGQTGGP
jgi:hypothetical protein